MGNKVFMCCEDRESSTRNFKGNISFYCRPDSYVCYNHCISIKSLASLQFLGKIDHFCKPDYVTFENDRDSFSTFKYLLYDANNHEFYQ